MQNTLYISDNIQKEKYESVYLR